MKPLLTPDQVKSLYNRYTYNSIVTEGKGVDRYIVEIEFKDGTPLTVEQIEYLQDHFYEDHAELIECKYIN